LKKLVSGYTYVDVQRDAVVLVEEVVGGGVVFGVLEV
jgi:hypothetical protein